MLSSGAPGTTSRFYLTNRRKDFLCIAVSSSAREVLCDGGLGGMLDSESRDLKPITVLALAILCAVTLVT